MFSYTLKRGSPRTRRGDGDANVIFGWEISRRSRAHTELSECRYVCRVEIVPKTKYLEFGSPRRVARDVGRDITHLQSQIRFMLPGKGGMHFKDGKHLF